MILLHGTFVDEVLIEIVLPLAIFVGLYWWSSRKEKKKRAAEEVRPEASEGRGEKAKPA